MVEYESGGAGGLVKSDKLAEEASALPGTLEVWCE